MKKTLAALAALMIAATSYGQGTLLFNNRDTGNGIDAPVSAPGGTVGAGSVANMTAQLFLVGTGGSLTALTPTTTFRTTAGLSQFYVNPPGDPITVPGIAGGTAVTLRMVAFNGATFATSGISGQSKDFTITLGNAVVGGNPPTPPAPLIGLTGFTTVSVPEPTTIALGILGLGALLIRRKK